VAAGTFYLSGNMSPSGVASVLCDRHDHGLALWQRTDSRVELRRIWEFERISGQKHHYWPLFTQQRIDEFLGALLAAEGLNITDVSASWGTPGLPCYRPIVLPAGAESFPVHSLAHLFSGLVLDSDLFRTETIVGMALDHGPDFVLETRNPPYWYAGCVSRGGSLTFAPARSPAPLYTMASALFGQEPGTLMALASACRTSVEMDPHQVTKGLELYGGRANPLVAAGNALTSIMTEATDQLAHGTLDDSFSPEDNLQSAVMKVVQGCCEVIAVENVERLLALCGTDPRGAYLSTSGGFALNCPTNTLLMDRYGFRGLLTPPCANDSGQALGLGLLGLRSDGMLDAADVHIDTAFYGADVTDADAALAEFAPWIADVSTFDGAQFVRDISDGVVAWVAGRAEIGPRALGHRSLLGDPRSARVKDLLNEYKQRQWWRPVAPIVLAEHVGAWFVQDRPSPFMLEAVQVRPDRLSLVPAVVHLDGSARHQVLTADADPPLHGAISAFYAETGIPLLCNTSLNDKGEPIVNTASEALNFCVRKGIAVAYLAGTRVALRQSGPSGPPVPPQPRERQVGFFAGQEHARDEIWDGLRGDGYTDEAIALMVWHPELRTGTGGMTAALVNELADHTLQHDQEISVLARLFLETWGYGSRFDITKRLAASTGV
jgi:carbamoyltransferase